MKNTARKLVQRFPFLITMALLPVFAPLRHFAYRLVPQIANALAGRFYVRGDIASASKELASANIAGPVAEKIAEIKQVISKDDFPAPTAPKQIRAKQAQFDAETLSVVHALHNALPLDQAGYAQRSQALLKAQTQQGLKVHPYTRLGYPHDLGRSNDATCKENTIVDGILYRLMDPHSSLRRQHSEQTYITHYAAKLVEAACTHQAHIIHGHSNYLNGLAASWAAKWSGRKSVYEVRGLWHLTRASLEPDFTASPLFAFQQILELQAMKEADAVVTLSLPLKQWMVEHGINEDKIHIIGNAIDTDHFRLPPPDKTLVRKYGLSGKVVIGYAGSLIAYEGLDILLRAVAKCLGNQLELALVIVGEGSARKSLAGLTKKLAITDHVHFVGKVAPNRVPAFLDLFDICVLPRLDVPICRLVPPLKPLEIMAAQKPLIVSALPPLMEFGVEDKSRLSFPPGNTNALAEQIARLMLDKKLRTRLGKGAGKWVRKNGSWQQNVKKYAQLYKGLCHD